MTHKVNIEDSDDDRGKDKDRYRVALPRFTGGDMFKFAAAVVFVAMAWARMESGLSAIEARLDKMDSLYVRRDVNEETLRGINVKLDTMHQQLERVEMKLEK